ncbi:hypothetical protein Zmor_016925 [Zophobas morio]|uniref:Uncharacterized protein n=1 Tax=Zophobas morio TaxID=2755281 RepID=A0AA38IBB8_9CUCU|nr:hypothetical protein Zmor_016925 [Zophobas morio]
MGNTYVVEVCNETTNDIIHVDIQGKVAPVDINTKMASDHIRPHCSQKFVVGNPASRIFFFGPPMFADSFRSLFGLGTIQCSVVTIFQNYEKDDFLILLRRQNKIELQFTQKTHEVEVIKVENGQDYRITFRHTDAQITNQKVEQRHQKGITAMMDDDFSRAQKKFEKALQTATEQSTKEAIRSSKKELKKSMDQKAKRMHMEGLQFLKIDRYDEALAKFEESLKLAKERDTTDIVTKSRDKTQKLKISEEKSLKFKEEAERLLALHKYDAALKKIFKALDHAENDKTRTSLQLTIKTIEKTKTNEQKCAEILKEATSLLKEYDYETCLTKLEEALKLTKKEDTICDIKNKISEAQEIKVCEEMSQRIISDAQKFLREYQYEKALHTFETALNYAKKEKTLTLINDNIAKSQEEQKKQEKSEKLNEEGH